MSEMSDECAVQGEAVAQARERVETDVAIVGGGVGGIAAALWCTRLALRCVLLERSGALGGQLFHIHNPIPDYPGLLCDGKAFAGHLTAQLDEIGIVPQMNETVQEVSLDEGILYTNGKEIHARAIVAATGARRRRLDVPGAAAFDRVSGGGDKAGLYYSFSGHRDAFRGRAVCVVGGGDGAFENALMLVECCPKVSIVMRRDIPRARQDFVTAAEQHPSIEILRGAHVSHVRGDDKGLNSVTIRTNDTQRKLEVGAVLVKIGLAPVNDWLGGACDMTPSGTLIVDANQQTSHPNVWAIGDICTLQDPSISVSVGQACLAARHIQRRLTGAS